jgi:hypothetical protein
MTAARLLIACLLVTPLPARAEDEVPFPTKTSILREGGVVYFVEGRQRIPKGARVSCQKNVKIVGRGEAVLEIEGDLKVHGVQDREVIFENVWIEPQARFGAIQLDMTIFRDGGGIRTPAQQSVDGNVVIENSTFEGSSGVDVKMAGGEFGIRASSFHSLVSIKAVTEEGKRRSSLKFDAIGNYNPLGGRGGGFLGGLVVEGAHKPTVRNTHVAGAKCSFVDCTGVTFDGNKVKSNLLSLQATVPGCFRGTKIQKCDIYSARVSFRAPADAGETVILDKCWFKGLTKKNDILEQVIQDSADDPQNGVTAKFRKINARPLELAGALDR